MESDHTGIENAYGLMYASIPTGAVFMLINTIIVVYYQITGEDVK